MTVGVVDDSKDNAARRERRQQEGSDDEQKKSGVRESMALMGSSYIPLGAKRTSRNERMSMGNDRP